MTYSISSAQENTQDSCEAIDVAREIDAAYNTFLATRSTLDSDQLMRTADDFLLTLQGILANCGSVAASDDPLFAGYAAGDGTIENPYGFNQAGESSNGVTIRPVDFIRPADDIIQEDEPAYHEWAIVTVEATCPITHNGDCRVGYENFRLMGESGTLYDSYFALQYAEQLEASIPPGRSREGGIAFIVPDEEANLRLVYYPDPYAFFGEQPVTYHRAQPSIEVSATARLIVRGGPGTQYAPLDALERDTRVNAIGRNDSGRWIRIDNGWVSAEYVNTGDSDLNLLPIIDAEN
ncbi:MAG: SH3 domain-containing protein [Anaerolineae bacterium]|nr:SH3 domain-containing protein [Anaerolineae bacterium]